MLAVLCLYLWCALALGWDRAGFLGKRAGFLGKKGARFGKKSVKQFFKGVPRS